MAKKLTRTQIHGDDCGSAALRQPTCDMSFVVGGRHKQWRRAQSKANATLAPAPKIARGFTRPRDGSNVKAHLAGHMALNWRAPVFHAFNSVLYQRVVDELPLFPNCNCRASDCHRRPTFSSHICNYAFEGSCTRLTF